MKGKSVGKLFSIIFITVLFLVIAVFDFNGFNNFSVSSIKQGLDLKGGVSVLYEADNYEPTAAEMVSAQSLIQKRLDEKGYTEAEVAPSGTNRLMVDIPGVDNAEDAVNTIGQTARLTFVDGNGIELLSGEDVADASEEIQTNDLGVASWVVKLKFNQAGQSKFAEATGNNVGNPLVIMLDDTVISAPIVNQKIISDTAVIDGGFTQESAKELASLIKSGSLPFSLSTISINNVGAKLGEEALSTSLRAGLLGICLVLIFMIVVYKAFGLVANLALLLYVGLMTFLLNLFGVTLTLPGIAGIILSIGMAVDANVIIFERIKEEMKGGKTLRSSVQSGFGRAFPAILDGNVTTLIAAVVLFWLGTGTIKGFAQTLAIGIILSMFTALVITKTILKALVGMGVTKNSYYGVKEATE